MQGIAEPKCTYAVSTSIRLMVPSAIGPKGDKRDASWIALGRCAMQ